MSRRPVDLIEGIDATTVRKTPAIDREVGPRYTESMRKSACLLLAMQLAATSVRAESGDEIIELLAANADGSLALRSSYFADWCAPDEAPDAPCDVVLHVCPRAAPTAITHGRRDCDTIAVCGAQNGSGAECEQQTEGKVKQPHIRKALAVRSLEVDNKGFVNVGSKPLLPRARMKRYGVDADVRVAWHARFIKRHPVAGKRGSPCELEPASPDKHIRGDGEECVEIEYVIRFSARGFGRAEIRHGRHFTDNASDGVESGFWLHERHPLVVYFVSRAWELTRPPPFTFRLETVAARLLNNRGFGRHKKKDYAGSAADFARAFSVDSSFGQAAFNLACAHSQLGHRAEALAALRDACRVNPKTFARKAARDSDLAGLRTDPRFDQVMRECKPVK